MNSKELFTIVHVGQVILKNISLSQPINYDKEKIDKIWNEKYKKINNTIFNDKVLTFHDSFINGKILTVTGKYEDYSLVISSREDSSLKLNIKQIGVSGAILLNDTSGLSLLFAIRSVNSTEYPGFLELVPSGNLDTIILKKNGQIDYIEKIFQEFQEETGLSNDVLKNVSCIGLVFDPQNQVYDVCCLLEITSSKNEIIKSFEKVSEYVQPKLIPVNTLSDFVKKNRKKITPTSLGIISILQSKNNLI